MTASTTPFAFDCDILSLSIPSIHTYDINRLKKNLVIPLIRYHIPFMFPPKISWYFDLTL